MVAFLNSTAFTAFGAATTWAEVLGFVTGALCVYLVGRQSLWNWPIGIVNNLVWILLFATAGLYADSALQIIYIALAIWGWHNWIRGTAGDRLPVAGTGAGERAVLAALGVAGTAVLTMLLDTATNSTVPFWDAVTTVLSLLATWGQATKRWESWLLWIAADLVYIPLYVHKGLTLTALLYAGFLILCVRGLIAWRRSRVAAPELVAVA
ncbi:nicotinamide riboside transporter PnuC [Rhodococcus sp. NPDC003318]|uniref:nicotinamide riboside transporter PnuC n=1 Tax=Rhodococcus sp. NPDC003318 TaxID=3364503 RepID=UPI0036B100D2